MQRVQENGTWSLFCPAEAPGLHDVWGEEFEALYAKYEAAGLARKTIQAHDLWYAILEAQIETGGPFMLYKDAANREFSEALLDLYFLSIFRQVNQTSKTSARSSRQTCARRLSNIPLLTRQLCAILHLWPSRLLSPMESTTSRSCMKLRRSSRTI